MKVSKLLAVVILLLTSFVDLYGVLVEVDLQGIIKTVELRTRDDRFLVRFDFINVEDFEKIRFDHGYVGNCCHVGLRGSIRGYGNSAVKIKEKLQRLYNDFGKNAPANTKVCFVRFENFGKKIKLEESLGQFFREYGIGPFYPLPKMTTAGRCCYRSMCALGPAIFLLGLFFSEGLSTIYLNRCIDACPFVPKGPPECRNSCWNTTD